MKEPLNYQKAINWAEKYLINHKIINPRYNSELILAHTLKKSRLKIIMNTANPLSKIKYHKFIRLIKKRAKGIPLDYLLGEADFYGYRFIVNKNVLIPRNETEMMIDKILDLKSDKKNACIIDVGTGSGAIAVTLAKKLYKTDIIAIDISKKALDIAMQNSKRLKVNNRIKFIKSSFINIAEKYNAKKYNHVILAANLPYVETAYLKKLIKNNKLFEPIIALDGGKDGLNIIRKFTLDFKKAIKDNVIYDLFLEMSHPQVNTMKVFIEKCINSANVKIYKDYNNKNRIIHAKFIGSCL